MGGQKYRLVTRSDFDGLACAVLMRELDLIDTITFVHPKDMQDGLVEVGSNDITTNLPFVPGVHLAFDHHLSEAERVGGQQANHIIDPKAPSAARVVFDHFGGVERFPNVPQAMMAAVDKADSADYDIDDILKPTGWTLLNFLMDPRTGLGRFRNFKISNYQLMMTLIEYCRDHDVDSILAAARRGGAGRAVLRAGEAVHRSGPPAGRGSWRCRRPGPARGGSHPCRQPLHDLRAAIRRPASPCISCGG